MNHLQSLMRYKQWADELMHQGVQQVPEHELTAPRPIVFGSILRTVYHILAMDQVWRAHLSGQTHDFTSRNPEHCPDLDTVRSKQEEMDRWYIEYADSLSSADAGEAIEFSFIGGNPGRMTREEILLHVVNHATYHRGHVADMMFNLSIRPPTTDYPVYLSSL